MRPSSGVQNTDTAATGTGSYGCSLDPHSAILGMELTVKQNTDVMQQDADFITADFLYMFRASCAHHQEYKILTR